MQRAVVLAEQGAGRVSPNPLVGCVIARQDECISEGWHKSYGDVHAEIDALQKAEGEDLSAATMYVTLEPCAHVGKQPACASTLATTTIPRFVIGCVDPNPLVSGSGLNILQQSGKEVVTGVCQDSCAWLARYFLFSMRTGLPYIVGKMAVTSNRRIAMPAGNDRWITGIESRSIVHSMRSTLDAVMIGIRTVIADDPMLDVRHVAGRSPARIIIDPSCHLPIDSAIVRSCDTYRTIVITAADSTQQDQRVRLQDCGVEIITIDRSPNELAPREIARTLHSLGLQSILLEGGPVTLDNFLRANLVQEMHIHESPIVVAGERSWSYDFNTSLWHLTSSSSAGNDQHYVYTLNGLQESLL